MLTNKPGLFLSHRSCLQCGSIFSNNSLFCLYCEQTLWSSYPKQFRCQIANYSVNSLFKWEPKKDWQLSKLIEALKGGKPRSAFEYYSQKFVSTFKGPISKRAVLVPSPGIGQDHAFVFAHTLGQFTSLPILNCLQKQRLDDLPQKRRNKEQRKNMKMLCHADLRNYYVIFIDDVVTTGATFKAARKAIGPCQGFEVWAIAQRDHFLRL